MSGSINSEPAPPTTNDAEFADSLESALDDLLGSGTKNAVMRFLAVENDFFNVVNLPDGSNKAVSARPVSQMTREQVEKKLRMLFGVDGAAPILEHVSRQIGIRELS
ncbi:MAG: hypothetical protein ABI361_08675 [Nitrososphaera sp.]|jgi:hypothetical protein